MITHHPTEEFMVAYAAGTLDEANSLAIAAHLTLCPTCRDEIAVYEALGATLVEELPEAVMAPQALAATLERVRHASRPLATVSSPLPSRHAPTSSIMLPAPLRHYVGGDIGAAKWQVLGPGIHHMPLVASEGVTARLLRIAPGRAVFDHGHGGLELTLVLNGSYQSQGKRFTRGDLEVADENVNHRPVAGMEDVCICLAVTDAPLRFDSWIGRLMQPFIGI
nr:ChrR family anti-sigma-E factor [uncultured Dongia sp.]